jgi:hypothetical protein
MSDGMQIPLGSLSSRLDFGDVVFVRVLPRPFRRVAEATGSWTNHVGIVVGFSGATVIIAESKFPLSRLTPFSAFAGRSEQGRIAVLRLTTPLTPEQRARLRLAAQRRLYTLYDTGFNLHSRRQFCSRFVREVIDEATDIRVGQVQTLAAMLNCRPHTDLGFWKMWYFGRIPWTRETVSPASLLESQHLNTVFNGFVMPDECLGRPWRKS